MAVAKRRQSKARRDSRRAQWMKMTPPAFAPCPHCGEARMPHVACAACGKYGDTKSPRVVIAVETEATENT